MRIVITTATVFFFFAHRTYRVLHVFRFTLKCVEITWYLLIMVVILYLFIFVVICLYWFYFLICVDIH